MSEITKQQAQDEFAKYQKKVTPNDVDDVLQKEDDILKKSEGPLAKFATKIKLLFSVIKDYKNGSYKDIPWTTIAAIIGALIYVFSPIDLIPDFIPGIGLVDDAAVLSLCLKAISNDLEKYQTWKKSKKK